MIRSLLNLLIFSSWISDATRNCFQETNQQNYLFLNDLSQIKIPLVPLNCHFCQQASQIDIQLIDEQFQLNRTVQHIKINLKNFEIEESSYICLIPSCPILVEYGSDILTLNITSVLFSHFFLSLIYFNESNLCSIQTRFAIYSSNHSLTCTKEIHLHPRFTFQIVRQLKIYDCQAESFYENIYEKTIRFDPFSNHQQFRKSSDNSCEFILENRFYLINNSLEQIKELSTRLRIFPLYNPWKKEVQTIGSCYTKIVPYKKMFFTENLGHIRKIYIQQGQSMQIECPIDGSEQYIKYTWYYHEYQISTNRTIILQNLTEHMQGRYICIANDDNEKIEFEMNLHLFKSTIDSFYLIIILIFLLLLLIILFSLLFIFIIYFLFKNSFSIQTYPSKPNAYTIHHNVLLTIQHISSPPICQSFWNEEPYQSLNFIDHKPIYIKQNQLSHRYLTRQRNINGQIAVNVPLIQSTSDTNLSSNEINNEMKILKISIPLLNEYSLRTSSSTTIHSFDSQNELNEFNQMSCVCMDSYEFKHFSNIRIM